MYLTPEEYRSVSAKDVGTTEHRQYTLKGICYPSVVLLVDPVL